MTENARGCYCGDGETSCGTCERCGGAGHTRHFPGPVPYTGAWCDRCYRIVEWTHPTRWLALIAILLLAAPFLARCVG